MRVVHFIAGLNTVSAITAVKAECADQLYIFEKTQILCTERKVWRQHQRSKRSIRNEVQVLKSSLDEYEADDSEKVLILNWYDKKEIMVLKKMC